MKVVHNKNYYLDIGNSTIKLTNDGKEFYVYHIKKLKHILKKLKENNVYAFSTNLNKSIKKFLNKYQMKFPTFNLIDKLEVFKIIETNDIDREELGIDIIFSVYYLNSISRNYMFINLGTFLFSAIVRNQHLSSVNIDIGINERIQKLSDALNVKNDNSWDWYGTNTKRSIKSAIGLQLFGIFDYYQNKMKSTEFDYYISGNDANIDLLSFLNTEKKTSINEYCALKGLIRYLNKERNID